jgi:hypothetical protein
MRNILQFHSEPFAWCHSEPFASRHSERSEESYVSAQDKLREESHVINDVQREILRPRRLRRTDSE